MPRTSPRRSSYKKLRLKNYEKNTSALNTRISPNFPVGKLHHIHALHNINLDIYPGEIFGLVGESGCGKSTLAKAVMGIHKPSKGEIFYKNQCISKSRIEKELKKTIQRSLQIIFQDSSVSLNPRMNIEDCMAEPFIIHKLFPNKKERQKKIAELLESVGMDSSFLQKSLPNFPADKNSVSALQEALP